MYDLLASLLEGLQNDTRNVLLTLARIWHTACRGTFVSKDQAAFWAIPKLAGDEALILAEARQACRGEITVRWHSGDRDAARRLAKKLPLNITEALTAKSSLRRFDGPGARNGAGQPQISTFGPLQPVVPW